MKKTILILTAVLLVANTFSASANEIPRESAPVCAEEGQILLTESLVSDILLAVQNGMGYAEARAKSNSILFNAVIANQTDGNGFGILSAIANNAIFVYRDMYLRPEYYAETEKQLAVLLADIIAEVENGTTDYNAARKEAYIRILQAKNPAFNAKTLSADFCYWDIPAVDSALFTQARKLLLNARSRAA